MNKKSIEAFLSANKMALNADIPLKQKKEIFMKALEEDGNNYLAIAALGKNCLCTG